MVYGNLCACVVAKGTAILWSCLNTEAAGRKFWELEVLRSYGINARLENVIGVAALKLPWR